MRSLLIALVAVLTLGLVAVPADASPLGTTNYAVLTFACGGTTVAASTVTRRHKWWARRVYRRTVASPPAGTGLVELVQQEHIAFVVNPTVLRSYAVPGCTTTPLLPAPT